MPYSAGLREVIEKRAYSIWEREGCLHGNDWAHWFHAEAEIDAKGIGSDDNERLVAEDFRRQIQERCGDPGFVAISGVDEFLTWMNENEAWINSTFSAMGLPPEAKAEYVATLKSQKLSTPHDDPGSRIIMEGLCRPVEEALHALGISLKGSVAYGTLLQAGIDASQLRVPLTSASVIGLNVALITFCSAVSKAVALTLPYEMIEGTQYVAFNIERMRQILQAQPNLSWYWAEIVRSYALHRKPVGVPRVVLRQDAVGHTRGLIRHAMELFAVGHEYGHHVEEHSLGGIAAAGGEFGVDLHRQEHEADLLSALLSIRIGANKDTPNLYAYAGVGAIMMLGTRDLVRRATQVVRTGVDQIEPSITHPTLDERLRVLENFWMTHTPSELGHLRETFKSLLIILWDLLRPKFEEMHATLRHIP
jgi:hypothetical protein